MTKIGDQLQLFFRAAIRGFPPHRSFRSTARRNVCRRRRSAGGLRPIDFTPCRACPIDVPSASISSSAPTSLPVSQNGGSTSGREGFAGRRDTIAICRGMNHFALAHSPLQQPAPPTPPPTPKHSTPLHPTPLYHHHHHRPCCNRSGAVYGPR